MPDANTLVRFGRGIDAEIPFPDDATAVYGQHHAQSKGLASARFVHVATDGALDVSFAGFDRSQRRSSFGTMQVEVYRIPLKED